MRQYEIRGGRPLYGSITLQGAKNSALPLMAACLLCTEGVSCLDRCPILWDTALAGHILTSLGCGVIRTGGLVTVDAGRAVSSPVSREYCAGMRSSVLYLGPMLARFRKADLYFPGGCSLGARPIDIHIKGLEQMGASFSVEDGHISAVCPKGLHGTVIDLPFPSVGATENIMMAACLAKGRTTIRNAAIEPEILDLADFIGRMGGNVHMDGRRVTVSGTEGLRGCYKKVMPDRIAAITYFTAALAANGNISVRGAESAHMRASMEILKKAGAAFDPVKREIGVRRTGKILPVRDIITAPYPRFPTDDMAAVMSLLTMADGVSTLRETVFSDRFALVGELRKLGADITVRQGVAAVRGVRKLYGAKVRATDLRAGAALIVAGLAADGLTVIEDDGHIERGYENITGTLRDLGAQITEREL